MNCGWPRIAARIACLAVLLFPAGGCHVVRAINAAACHDVQGYQKQTSVPQLRIPAGLDAPDTTNALRLPTLNEPAAPPRRSKAPCLDYPPPFKVQQAARTPSA
jgi:uncharacterized lipoprotein